MERELPMACTCRACGVRETETRRLKIFRRLGLEGALEGRPASTATSMMGLTEAIVLSLAFDFLCDVDIDVDMWFGIWFQSPLLADGSDSGTHFIACDAVEDGLAAVWEAFDTEFPDAATRAPELRAPTDVPERISAALLAAHERAEADFRAHWDAVHPSVNGERKPWCKDCEVLCTLSVSTRESLSEVWGSRRIDTCVEKVLRERHLGD